MIESDSFGGSSFKLQHYKLEGRASELNEAAAKISRKAAGDNAWVIASIGPTGKMLAMGDATEACLAIKAVKKNTKLEAICTFTFEKTLQGYCRTTPDHISAIRKAVDAVQAKKR